MFAKTITNQPTISSREKKNGEGNDSLKERERGNEEAKEEQRWNRQKGRKNRNKQTNEKGHQMGGGRRWNRNNEGQGTTATASRR